MHSDIAAGLGASKGGAASSNIIELFPGRERGDIELAEIYARHLLDERDAEIASIRASLEALMADLRKTLKFYRLPPERRAAIESARQVARNYPEVTYNNRVRRRWEKAKRRAEEAYDALAKAAPDIHEQIRGRELELIKKAANSGFHWPPANGKAHVHCPFPDHSDENPSWRWDDAKCRYFCTCPPGGGSAIDALMRLKGLDFQDAANWAREQLGLATKRENITLEAYAEKKKLPIEFLRDLGLKTIQSPWGGLAPFSWRGSVLGQCN
jgi:hypothetical protein